MAYAIYLHRLTVTVITEECSPDRIERLIEQACSDVGMRADARTDPRNRLHSPAIQIADPPKFATDLKDKRVEQAWANAHDAWKDSWPEVADFAEVERARGCLP
jgi:hypothetical protein